jgi:hypothetical protein
VGLIATLNAECARPERRRQDAGAAVTWRAAPETFVETATGRPGFYQNHRVIPGAVRMTIEGR